MGPSLTPSHASRQLRAGRSRCHPHEGDQERGDAHRRDDESPRPPAEAEPVAASGAAEQDEEPRGDRCGDSSPSRLSVIAAGTSLRAEVHRITAIPSGQLAPAPLLQLFCGRVIGNLPCISGVRDTSRDTAWPRCLRSCSRRVSFRPPSSGTGTSRDLPERITDTLAGDLASGWPYFLRTSSPPSWWPKWRAMTGGGSSSTFSAYHPK